MDPYKDLGHICHPPDSEYDPINKRWHHKSKEPSAIPYTIAAIAAFILLIAIVRLF